MKRRVPLPALMLVGLLLTTHAAAQLSPCSLVDMPQVRAIAPGFVPPLAADAPGPLTATELPGLPTPLTLLQCTGGMNAAGAITFRLGLLGAQRELTNAEWRAVDRLLGVQAPAAAGEVACWREAQRSKSGGLLHEAGCGQARGRYRLQISVEHPDSTLLPTEPALRALLARALLRLP
jgi:hypothetical protein